MPEVIAVRTSRYIFKKKLVAGLGAQASIPDSAVAVLNMSDLILRLPSSDIKENTSKMITWN